MGMYDHLTCKYPLPLVGANERHYQTKDLECMLDNYEIREDGTLWHEAYDSRFEEDEKAFFGFYIYHDNKRWEVVEYTGEVRFYDFLPSAKTKAQKFSDGNSGDGWIEWSAYFHEGKLKELHLIEHREPGGEDG